MPEFWELSRLGIRWGDGNHRWGMQYGHWGPQRPVPQHRSIMTTHSILTQCLHPSPLPESPFWSLLPGQGLSQLCLPLQGLLCSADCVLNPSYLNYGYESRDFKFHTFWPDTFTSRSFFEKITRGADLCKAYIWMLITELFVVTKIGNS